MKVKSIRQDFLNGMKIKEIMVKYGISINVTYCLIYDPSNW